MDGLVYENAAAGSGVVGAPSLGVIGLVAVPANGAVERENLSGLAAADKITGKNTAGVETVLENNAKAHAGGFGNLGHFVGLGQKCVHGLFGQGPKSVLHCVDGSFGVEIVGEADMYGIKLFFFDHLCIVGVKPAACLFGSGGCPCRVKVAHGNQLCVGVVEKCADVVFGNNTAADYCSSELFHFFILSKYIFLATGPV